MKKFYFLTNEDALVFAAKVNGRREHLRHYETALKGDVTENERDFLVRITSSLRSQIEKLMETA